MRAVHWVLGIALLVTGCAGVEATGSSRQPLHRRHLFREQGFQGVERRAPGDAFDALLRAAGLDERDAQPLEGGALTPTQAARLMKVLLAKPVTLGQFPSRLAVGHVLRSVMGRGETSRAELVHQVERFTGVAVLRPDGCIAWARDGRTQQRAGPVEWRDGGFRAHGFVLGRFYEGRSGVYRLLDDDLREVDGRPVAEVYDDADYVGRVLDGAGSAGVKLALSIGQFFTYPLDSITALEKVPAGVAALIESSPAYFERFRYMTRGEQIQAVAELATNLLFTTGTAGATTRTVTGALAGAEAMVPRLALSSSGVVTLERVAVPMGRAASVLGGGPGAVIILQRAVSGTTGGAPSKEPGQWGPAQEGMSDRARRYQEQITGHSADEASWVGGVGTDRGGVKFDGFKDGVLQEAKGPGYANKFLDNLKPRIWFENSGARALVEQAQRQLAKAPPGVPIEWFIAEEKTAEAIRTLFQKERIVGIKVLHVPPL
ncbi:restriction endonuclease fold toxin 5 domain-containing protein [Myxococcus sp. K15C18031901]|uniref:Tox-REase-5 domain-containing protein n=1 Tax=Myxococcus dinghuensis TaxID=2906761 RepID=UPI0020A778B4|nr:Tox-REase-5 domain-containing protein [Myxococcus dinghuensis]MCP3100255.1 restriction endonuclease fold toxin 5 domain-containing protein [Myxococcus dinghuensis]